MLSISGVLRRAQLLFPDRVAVRAAGLELTYRELADRVNRFSAGLVALGIGRGDRVAILDVNSSHYIEAYYAAAQIGAILIPLNSRLAAEEVSYALEDAGANTLMYGARFQPIIESVRSKTTCIQHFICHDSGPEAPGGSLSYEAIVAGHRPLYKVADVGLDDTCSIYYTSGTTGLPKGVCLTYRNMTASMYDAALGLRLGGDDVWMHAAPLFHLVDAWAVWAIPLLGGTQVPVHFDPAAFVRMVKTTGTTCVALPPTMIGMLLGGQDDLADGLRTLRLIMFGGSPASQEVLEKATRTLSAKLVHAYGTTETSGIVTLNTLATRANEMSAAGFPLPQIRLDIFDDKGHSLPPGEVGEVVVRGERVMSGYWQNRNATAEAIRSGWYHTGDLGIFDAAKGVTILDRKKDMIITGGENVYSAEVESALASHPSVQEVAVIGVPHEKWGEAVTAIVVTKSPVAVEELIDHCKRKIAGYKAPKSIEFVDALPKNATGKVVKRALRDRYATKQ
jgi:long-chain acyl-CoA synthetase